jgi:hypothetical protein
MSKLHKKITHQLEQLQTLINQIEEVQNIDPDDPDTWDTDTLYNLIELLKEALTLLEDKESLQKDDFGQPLILEEGLCSLVDSYQEENDH